VTDALALWVTADWDAPDAIVGVIDEYLHAVRATDAVQLAIATGSLGEEEAGARLVALLADLPAFARYAGPHLPDITVYEGDVPADVPADRRLHGRADAAPVLRALRDRLASFVAVTPAYNRAEWARTWRPEPGFRHLVVDNASTDGTGELLEDAGAEVIRQPRTIERVLNWRSALESFRDHTDAPWMKWLFAGDELRPGAADTLRDAIAAHPEARLVVAEFLWRYPDGTTRNWRTVGETRLVEPAEAIRRACKDNWFGGPIAHCVHRDAVDDAHFGTQPWVADWQACLNIARRHPVLYVAEPIGVLNLEHRLYHRAHENRPRSVVQDWTIRLEALDALRELAPGPQTDELEREMHVRMVHECASVVNASLQRAA
jgi:hypothetical protein